MHSAQTRQMQRLVITTTLPTRRITTRLQIHIIVPTRRARARQEVQLPSVATPRRSDNRIALERPRRRRPRRGEFERLVARACSEDVKVLTRVRGLDRAADVEGFGAGLGAHYGDGLCGV